MKTGREYTGRAHLCLGRGQTLRESSKYPVNSADARVSATSGPLQHSASTVNAECRRVNSQFQDEFTSSTVDPDSRIVQQRAKRGTPVIDEIGYRLMRQLRSPTAGPKIPGPCRPNVASLDAASWQRGTPSS